MRHLLPSPLAIAVLALCMGKAASTASLKALTGRTHGFTAGGLRAPLTAVAIAPVAVAANHHLAATTGTVEQTRTALHRPLLPMRAGFIPNREICAVFTDKAQVLSAIHKAMNIPTIRSAIPQEGHFLIVLFSNGKRKRYDINRLIHREMFSPLKDPAFFKNVSVEPGGYAVSWNSEIDISEYELWQHGEEVP